MDFYLAMILDFFSDGEVNCPNGEDENPQECGKWFHFKFLNHKTHPIERKSIPKQKEIIPFSSAMQVELHN